MFAAIVDGRPVGRPLYRGGFSEFGPAKECALYFAETAVMRGRARSVWEVARVPGGVVERGEVTRENLDVG